MKRWILGVVGIWLLSGLVASAAPLVTNGDFETGDLTGWTSALAPAGNSLLEVGPADVHFAVPAPGGGASAAWFGAIGTTDDTISQVLATVPGQSYVFDFWSNNVATNDPLSNHFSASWGGNTVLNLLNDGSFGWTQHSFTEIATGALTTISFSGRNDSTYFGLDNVSVSPSSAAPEPGTLTLLGVAGLAIVWWRRRKSA